jgi:hypothetical protein
MNPLHARRLRLVVVLVALLFGLCVWYGTYGVAPGLGAYPTEQVVGPTPGEYVGDSVVLSGAVVETDPVELRVRYGGGTQRTLTVIEVQTPVEPGDQLRVFGPLVDEDTVRATRTLAVPPSGYLYTYAVSFLAGVWVLIRLVRQWRLDPQHGLVRRTDPLTLDSVRAATGTEVTDDA